MALAVWFWASSWSGHCISFSCMLLELLTLRLFGSSCLHVRISIHACLSPIYYYLPSLYIGTLNHLPLLSPSYLQTCRCILFCYSLCGETGHFYFVAVLYIAWGCSTLTHSSRTAFPPLSVVTVTCCGLPGRRRDRDRVGWVPGWGVNPLLCPHPASLYCLSP